MPFPANSCACSRLVRCATNLVKALDYLPFSFSPNTQTPAHCAIRMPIRQNFYLRATSVERLLVYPLWTGPPCNNKSVNAFLHSNRTVSIALCRLPLLKRMNLSFAKQRLAKLLHCTHPTQNTCFDLFRLLAFVGQPANVRPI
jgi:hypothetical protein